jgi:hypothetical protein
VRAENRSIRKYKVSEIVAPQRKDAGSKIAAIPWWSRYDSLEDEVVG